MTGGQMTVLGETGVNFGAGMTGGYAYVYDQHGRFENKHNPELIDLNRLAQYPEHAANLREIIEDFVAETHSQWAQSLLDNFDNVAKQFWLVKPKASSAEQLLDKPKTAQAVA